MRLSKPPYPVRALVLTALLAAAGSVLAGTRVILFADLVSPDGGAVPRSLASVGPVLHDPASDRRYEMRPCDGVERARCFTADGVEPGSYYIKEFVHEMTLFDLPAGDSRGVFEVGTDGITYAGEWKITVAGSFERVSFRIDYSDAPMMQALKAYWEPNAGVWLAPLRESSRHLAVMQ